MFKISCDVLQLKQQLLQQNFFRSTELTSSNFFTFFIKKNFSKPQNADVVTLLRLHLLNEEIGSAEDSEPGENSTYNDVMRDFSHLANNSRLRGNKRDGNGSSSSSSITVNNMDNME